jgi:hypothetical protein
MKRYMVFGAEWAQESTDCGSGYIGSADSAAGCLALVKEKMMTTERTEPLGIVMSSIAPAVVKIFDTHEEVDLGLWQCKIKWNPENGNVVEAVEFVAQSLTLRIPA